MTCTILYMYVLIAYLGAVFRKYPTTKTKHRGVKKNHIADKEEQITTKDVGSVICSPLTFINSLKIYFSQFSSKIKFIVKYSSTEV